MIEDRAYRLAAGTWILLAVLLSVGLAQADVYDGLNSSIAASETDSLEATAVSVAETDNVTGVATEDGNKTVAAEPEMGTEPVTPPEAVTPAETVNVTVGEVATVPEIGEGAEAVEVEVAEEAEEAVRTVCIAGCSYSSIQAAIDAAKDGDVVEVESGTYNENLFVNKSITLKGVDTGEGAAVVNAQGSGSAVILKADGIVLEGLYITSAGPYPSAGIEIISDDNLISGCEIWNCKHWGIYLKGGSTNNTVSECITSNNGNDGVMIYKSPGNLFRENTVGNNGYNGIHIIESDNNVVGGNILGNNTNSGVYIDSSQNSVVMNNIITYNSRGIKLIGSGIDRVGPNRFLNNTQDLEVA
jgi:parallel beta-helix repeat protein